LTVSVAADTGFGILTQEKCSEETVMSAIASAPQQEFQVTMIKAIIRKILAT